MQWAGTAPYMAFALEISDEWPNCYLSIHPVSWEAPELFAKRKYDETAKNLGQGGH